MSYCHLWDARQGTALNFRCVRGHEEISTGREAQQIAITGAGKMGPNFFAAFLKSPMVKPGEITGRWVFRRQKFKPKHSRQKPLPG